MVKSKKKRLIAIILVVAMLVTVAVSIIAAEGGDGLDAPDPTEVMLMALTYNRTEDEIVSLYYELGSLEAVENSLVEMPDFGLFTQDEILMLYEQGISVLDMEKADELSYLSDLTSMEILNIKLGLNASDDEEAWEMVLVELGLDGVNRYSKTEFSVSELTTLMDNNYSDKDIYDMNELFIKYKIPFSRIFFDYESGLTYDDLKPIYKDEYKNSNKYKEEKEKKDKEMMDIISKKIKDDMKKKFEGDE